RNHSPPPSAGSRRPIADGHDAWADCAGRNGRLADVTAIAWYAQVWQVKPPQAAPGNLLTQATATWHSGRVRQQTLKVHKGERDADRSSHPWLIGAGIPLHRVRPSSGRDPESRGRTPTAVVLPIGRARGL